MATRIADQSPFHPQRTPMYWRKSTGGFLIIEIFVLRLCLTCLIIKKSKQSNQKRTYTLVRS
jgi:hypothetical protein